VDLQSQTKPAPHLKVLSLNLAHGRGEALHQALEDRQTIEANLDAIAEVLRRERPDVAAFQEADGPSRWSGGFNHVEYLAGRAELPQFARGEHVHGLGLSYGTALASRHRLADAEAVTFPPSPPTFSKGFTVGTVAWPGRLDLQVDVVSVHLDFARESVRRKQIELMAEKLAHRKRPLVVMGDFNGDWSDANGPLRLLAQRLNLQAYRPDAPGMETFPTTNARLDWILISSPLEFVEYRVLSDRVSDHRALVAVLGVEQGK
jgi:endonuclease/exonuclease/phosphatase family metal-dependent hydrolase